MGSGRSEAHVEGIVNIALHTVPKIKLSKCKPVQIVLKNAKLCRKNGQLLSVKTVGVYCCFCYISKNSV